MDQKSSPTALISRTGVKEYFHDSVLQALHNHHIKPKDATTSYLVNLLCTFTRTERLFEAGDEGQTTQALAVIYQRALNSMSLEERRHHLQRLGDIALFVSGVFSYSLSRKIVDIDYYIAMGGNAYGHLSACSGAGVTGRALADVFAELSEQFKVFVDILMEVSERSHSSRDTDVLRLYEVWMHTGSKRVEARLRRLGMAPTSATISRLQH